MTARLENRGDGGCIQDTAVWKFPTNVDAVELVEIVQVQAPLQASILVL